MSTLDYMNSLHNAGSHMRWMLQSRFRVDVGLLCTNFLCRYLMLIDEFSSTGTKLGLGTMSFKLSFLHDVRKDIYFMYIRPSG